MTYTPFTKFQPYAQFLFLRAAFSLEKIKNKTWANAKTSQILNYPTFCFNYYGRDF